MAQEPTTCASFFTAITRKKTFDHQNVMATPLKRCLSTFEVIFLGLGITATGIFGLPGLVIIEAGPAALLSTIIAGIAVIFISFNYIELCCRIPRAGSSYSYAYVTLGELPAFVVGWSIVLIYLTGIGGGPKVFSATLNVLTNYTISDYFAEAIPGWPTDSSWLTPYPDVVAAGVVLIATFTVLIGAEMSVWVVAAVGIGALVALAIVVVTMFVSADVANLGPSTVFAPNGLQGVLGGAATAFVLFTGFDAMTIAGEETKNPTKTVPIAVLFVLTFSTVLLFIATVALLLYVPYSDVTSPAVAFTVALDQRNVAWAGYIAASSCILGNFGLMLVSMFAVPRVLYSIASDGLLFPWLGTVWKSTQVPGYAMLACNGIALVLSFFFSFEWFANITSIAAMVAYSTVGVCVVVLRYSKPKEFLGQSALYRTESMIEAASTSATEKTPLVDDTSSAEKVPDADAKSDADTDYDAGRAGELYSWTEYLPIPSDMRAAEPGVVPLSMIGVYVVSAIVLVLVFIYTMQWIVDGAWWANFILAIFGVILLISVGIMALYRRSDSSIKTFKVPAVPYLPAISILLNFLLILALASTIWLWYLLWLLIGLMIYGFYGVRNSKVGFSESSSIDD